MRTSLSRKTEGKASRRLQLWFDVSLFPLSGSKFKGSNAPFELDLQGSVHDIEANTKEVSQL